MPTTDTEIVVEAEKCTEMERTHIPAVSAKRQRPKRDPNYVTPLGSVWIHEHSATLPNNEWVAATGAGLLAHDPTIDGLYDKIDASKIPNDEITIAFISRDPRCQ